MQFCIPERHQMSADSPLQIVREIVGVIKLGSGLLGKSAMVLGILMLCVCVAMFRLHSDLAILMAIMLGAVFFFAWFVPIIRFADKHPAEALLEGSQWAEHQRFQIEAKGYPPSTSADTIVPFTPTAELGRIGRETSEQQ